MHFITATALSMLAMQAQAKTIKVAVGQGGLKFTPDNIKASKGDTIEFSFYSSTHNVIQGDPTKACNPVDKGGFFSGDMKVTSGKGTKTFTVNVDSTDPIYIYCGIGQHCQAGMTAVINPKADGDVKSYADNAAKADKNVTPKGDAFGGTVADAESGSTTSGQSGSVASTDGSGTKTKSISSMSPTGGAVTGAMSGSATPTSSKAAPSSTGAASNLEGQFGAAVAAAAGLAAFIL